MGQTVELDKLGKPSIMFARPLSSHENRGATKTDIIRQLIILLCYISGVLLSKVLVVKKDKTFYKFVVGIHTGYKMELNKLH